MLKQLVIPFFVLSLAAVGCGSSSSGGAAGTSGGTAGTGTAGTTGTAGATAGTTGTAGATAGTTGTAGATAGTTGTAGTGVDASTDAPATDAATDTTTATDAGADMMSVDATPDATAPVCSTTTDPGAATTPKLSASDFCHLFLSTTGCMGVTGYTIPTGLTAEADCEANYTASTKQACRSYHLCGNAYDKATASKLTHCPHAAGGTAASAGPCQE